MTFRDTYNALDIKRIIHAVSSNSLKYGKILVTITALNT